MKTKSMFEDIHGNDAKFFFCNCGGHALLVERYDDLITLGLWGETGLTAYPTNLWERLRLVWAFLRGRLFVDDIILNKDEAKLVAEHLKELAIDKPRKSTKKLAAGVRRKQQD
jgi:hypothetical protein